MRGGQERKRKTLKLAVAVMAVAVLGLFGLAAYFLFLRHPASSIELFGVRYGQSCADFADAVFDGHQRYYEVMRNVRRSAWGSYEMKYKTKSAIAEACERGDLQGEIGTDEGFIAFASSNGTLMKLKVASDNNKIVGWEFYITVAGISSYSAIVGGKQVEGTSEDVKPQVDAEAAAIRAQVVAGLGAPLIQLPCGSASTKVWRFRRHLLSIHDCRLTGCVLELYSARYFLEDRLGLDEEMRNTLRKALRDDGLDL